MQKKIVSWKLFIVIQRKFKHKNGCLYEGMKVAQVIKGFFDEFGGSVFLSSISGQGNTDSASVETGLPITEKYLKGNKSRYPQIWTAE